MMYVAGAKDERVGWELGRGVGTVWASSLSTGLSTGLFHIVTDPSSQHLWALSPVPTTPTFSEEERKPTGPGDLSKVTPVDRCPTVIPGVAAILRVGRHSALYMAVPV